MPSAHASEGNEDVDGSISCSLASEGCRDVEGSVSSSEGIEDVEGSISISEGIEDVEGSVSSSLATVSIPGGIEDVQDFPWAKFDESCMSLERFTHLWGLMRRGNEAFRENRMDQAFELYSRSNLIKPRDSIILNNQYAAYLRINRSHTIATNAELATDDAEKDTILHRNRANSYLVKATAHIMLEEYEQAQDMIASGLQIDPQSNALGNIQRLIANRLLRINEVKTQRSDEYDCILCVKLLYEPITTPCGHSFCRSCLFRAMHRGYGGNRCPNCRTVVFISLSACAISHTLEKLIKKNFPEEYAERKSEHQTLINHGPNLLPLFAMDVILPTQRLTLEISEPRYILMVRRVMEGNRRMGMVNIVSSPGSLDDYGCEVEIMEYKTLPDGSFSLEVRSQRRYRIIHSWDQDGYRVADVEWVEDISPQEGKDSEQLLETTRKASDFARKFIDDSLQGAQGDRERCIKLNEAKRLMPSTRDPEWFSFWLAALANLAPEERLHLLRLRDTMERLMRVLISFFM